MAQRNPICGGNWCIRMADPRPEWVLGKVFACSYCTRTWVAVARKEFKAWESAMAGAKVYVFAKFEPTAVEKRLRAALEEVLDGLGALCNPGELYGWGISEERAKEIVALVREA